MKIIFSALFSAFIAFSSNSFAQTETKEITEGDSAPAEVKLEKVDHNAILAGLGYGVETGVLGIQYRRFFSKNIYFHISGLIEILGFGTGYGLGYQTDAKDEKCFWILDCKSRIRFSAGYLKYGGRDTDLSTGGETECENGFCVSFGETEGATYKSSSSSALTGTVAFQSQIGSTFFYELQIGFWTPSSKPKFKYKSGPQTPKDNKSLKELSESHLALGITTGFYF